MSESKKVLTRQELDRHQSLKKSIDAIIDQFNLTDKNYSDASVVILQSVSDCLLHLNNGNMGFEDWLVVARYSGSNSCGASIGLSYFFYEFFPQQLAKSANHLEERLELLFFCKSNRPSMRRLKWDEEWRQRHDQLKSAWEKEKIRIFNHTAALIVEDECVRTGTLASHIAHNYLGNGPVLETEIEEKARKKFRQMLLAKEQVVRCLHERRWLQPGVSAPFFLRYQELAGEQETRSLCLEMEKKYPNLANLEYDDLSGFK